MTVRSKYVGGALVYYETHGMRFLDAFGEGVTKRIERFADGRLNADTVDPTGWTSTVVEAGAGTTEFSPTDLDGGGGRITTAANENDGGNYQGLGEAFNLNASNLVYFGAEFRISEATQQDIFLGLAVTDTDILGGVTDRIGFQKLDASTDLHFLVEENNSETITGTALVTVVATTFYYVEFLYDGPGFLGTAGQLYAFLNGARVTEVDTLSLTNLPNEELRVSIQVLAGDANARTADFRRELRVIQIT